MQGGFHLEHRHITCIDGVKLAGDICILTFTQQEAGTVKQASVQSRDLLHWTPCETPALSGLRPLSSGAVWRGDVRAVYLLDWKGESIQFALGKRLSLPAKAAESPSIHPAVQRLRIWQRTWEDIGLGKAFHQPLRFRVRPGRWPDIRLGEADGTCDDVSAPGYEIHLLLEPAGSEQVDFDICGMEFAWKKADNALHLGRHIIPLGEKKDEIRFQIWMDCDIAEISTGNDIWMVEIPIRQKSVRVSNDMTGNVSFSVNQPRDSYLSINASGQTARLVRAEVYGLRSTFHDPEEQAIVHSTQRGKLLFAGKSYRLYENCVEDDRYGAPPAWIPDCNTIVSPVRVCEEFEWRKNKWGDMTRVVNRQDIWHPSYWEGRYPRLHTGIPVVDCAWKLALDTFYACTAGEFSYPGQEHMWSAGMFQGKGEGFGVWLRDSTHIALRGGNLIDPENARRTLLFNAKSGIDNGSDGDAMPAVGIWDYYLATGDSAMLWEAWPDLLDHIRKAQARYSPAHRLVKAGQSTSNDAFPEPENGGYALSSVIYYAKAFSAMAQIARVLEETSQESAGWEAMSEAMHQSIRKSFWNPRYGYFTSGPTGSAAHKNGYWETSGQEAAIWPNFEIADPTQRQAVLRKMEDGKMGEYGLDLFPYRRERNHLCNSVWNVWTSGFVAAANQENRSDLIERFLAQQMRSCLLHKSFYEVIDYETGEAWRWPGQLWQAAGIIACILYGVLGVQYSLTGMKLHPCLPSWMDRVTLSGLHFRDAVLDIVCVKDQDWINHPDHLASVVIPPGIHGKHHVQMRI